MPRTGRFTTREEAALAALDNMYWQTEALGEEWGAAICAQSNWFKASGAYTDHDQSSVEYRATACSMIGDVAARLHTHPPIESPLPNSRDLTNSDSHPGIPSYLMAPAVNSPGRTHKLKYWKSGGRTSVQNACIESSAGIWSPFLLVSDANANCATPIP